MKKRINFVNQLLPVVLFGSVSGILTGALISLYRFCAARIISLSGTLYETVRRAPIWCAAAVIAAVMLALLLHALYKKFPNLRGGGIPTSIAALRGLTPVRWICDIVGVFFLSLTSFLCGVPLGNEGPSVQMGTAIGRGCIAALPKKHRAWSRYAMTSGACAGFTAATGAPISGIMFALEDAHRRISPMIIMAAYFSVIFSNLTSSLLCPLFGISTKLFSVPQLPVLSAAEMWIPAAVGLTLGLFAVLFLRYYEIIHHFISRTLKKVPAAIKILGILLLTLLFGMISEDFISTGHHLIAELLSEGRPLLWLIAILAVRATLTLLANNIGMTGGLFLPIMALGAAISAVLATAVTHIPGGENYYTVILALGIIACISGMMKTPITAIAFAVEALGCYDNIIPVIIAATLSFTVTEIFRVESINEHVVESRVRSLHGEASPVVLETSVTVHPGSFAVGKQVRDILWPNQLFVLTVRHPLHAERSKDGSLCAGDELYVRYTTYNDEETREELAAIVGG